MTNDHKDYNPTQSMANPGMNYWVRSEPGTRRNATGRGLFSGLQDVKHYNVDNGWAERHVVDDGQNSWFGWFNGLLPGSTKRS